MLVDAGDGDRLRTASCRHPRGGVGDQRGERLRLLDDAAAAGAGELDDPAVGDRVGERLGGRSGIGALVLADDDDDAAP